MLYVSHVSQSRGQDDIGHKGGRSAESKEVFVGPDENENVLRRFAADYARKGIRFGDVEVPELSEEEQDGKMVIHASQMN